MSLANLRTRLALPPWRKTAALPHAGPSGASAAAHAGLAAVREFFSYHGAWAPGVRVLRLLSIRDKMALLAAMMLVPALLLAWLALDHQVAVAKAAAHRLAGLRLVVATSALRVELGARATAEETGRAFSGDDRQAAYQQLWRAYQHALAQQVPLQDAWERVRVSVDRALKAPPGSPDAQARTNAPALLALQSFMTDVVAVAGVTVSQDPQLYAQSELAVNDLPPLQASLAMLRRGMERLAASEGSAVPAVKRAALMEAAAALAVAADRHASALVRLRVVRQGVDWEALPAVQNYLQVVRRQLLAGAAADAAPGLVPSATTAVTPVTGVESPPLQAAAATPSAGLDRALLRQAYAAAREQVHTLRLAESSHLDRVLADLHDRAVWTRNSLLAGLVLGLLLTLYLMYTFYLVVRGGLDQLNLQISRMASGDLSSRAMPLGVDEVAVALRGMTVSLEQLSDLVASVTQGVGAVKHAAQQVATGNAELSGRNHLTAQGIAAVVDGVARYAVQLEACGRQVEQVVESVQTLRLESSRNRKHMLRLRERMVALRNKSHEIGAVVTLIDNIAFRTNILALNASVEASKAGEAGRGFAVVALEVRALANRGAESAQRIGDIIRRSTDDIEHSHALVEETGAAMAHADRQVDQIQRAVDGVAGLTRAGEKESTALLSQLTEIKGATADTLSLVQRVAQASDAMRAQGERLAYKLGRFKLS